MSLQFIFGNSGSGKSGYLYDTILEQASAEPDKNFLILVPEQFTMQTQRELVARQRNHAIMNVEVLSFARLAYRVFDELGKQELVILEETGKNLVLRKVAEQKKKELRVLGGNMNKMGYVGEVKSLISELTQYNIAPEDLERFLEENTVAETLRLKMQDILTMYRGFREYMEGRFITSEEILTLLCEVAEQSQMLRGSVIVFDEYTGFTPIQNRVLREFLKLADRILVSLTMDTREDFYHSRGVHELFAMSKKTVEVLSKMAQELHVEIEEPILMPTGKERRYKNAPALFFMEQNLFRSRGKSWEQKQGSVQENISITGLKDPRAELEFVAREITRLVRKKGYCYKDIAVVTGDVPGYGNYVPEIFEQYQIPFFIDQTRNILFHPFIEFIRAALEVVEYDFSYESIFRFLRCGLAGPILQGSVEKEPAAEEKNESEPRVLAMGERTGDSDVSGVTGERTGDSDASGMTEERTGDSDVLTEADIDRLENYVLARGIRGRRRWKETWTFVLAKEKEASSKEQEDMLHLNRVRAAIYGAFEPLFEVFTGKEHSVAEQTLALYRFIASMQVEAQLCAKEEEFGQEYAQIYKIVMNLLDKVEALLGEEKMAIREYGDILDAGFSAAKVGIIPPGNDRVTIGDIERTRLSHIKILFFAGVNDGLVPKNSNTGSIISQYEREKMAECHLELAPGAREKVFIQKFYLYLNMTKPSDALYVTFSRVGADGKALRRSYLIGTLLKMFPDMKVEEPEEIETTERLLTPESSMAFFVEGLQEGAFLENKHGENETEEMEEVPENGLEQASRRAAWCALADWYLSDESFKSEAERLMDAAFFRHTDEPVGRAVTKVLYGTTLENSVTRLERFASCAYAHYLNYGLQLNERQLQEFATVDMGNIYHDALEQFAKRVDASEYTWFDIPEEVRENWVEESMEDAVLGCQNAGVFEDAKNRYLLARMKETVRRAIWALVVQVQKGKFVPKGFEISFSRADDLKAIQFALSEEEKMRLRGRIDRVDVCETDDKVYVKIIDYKSGNTSFSLLNLYHGLQLQLVVYLNAAMELVAKRYPGKEVEPAGIFYYHVTNPMVDGNGTESESEIRRAVLEQLKLNGLVNEEPDIYRAMDTEFSGSSAVIPVALKTDGSLKATSKTASTHDFQTMSDYVNRILVDTGKKILAGDVAVQPYMLDNRTGCDYCPYHTVCGFDARIPGYSYRRLETFDDAETIMNKMREDKSEESSGLEE